MLKKCIICKESSFKKLHFFNETSGPKIYPLFKCNNCGLIKPYPQPYNETNKKKIYQTKISEINFDEDYKAQLVHFDSYKKAIKDYNITGSSLDIGCGKGHLIKISLERGLKAEGQEIDKQLTKALRKKGFKIHNTEVKKINSKYDLITMNHVLEHVDKLYEFMNHVNKILKKDGYFMIGVPYIYGIFPFIQRTSWYGQGFGQHLNFFSIKSIKKLLEDHNFDIIKIEILTMNHVPVRIPKLIRKAAIFILKIIVSLNLGDNIFIVAKKKSSL